MELRESDGGGLAREGSWAAAAGAAAGTCVRAGRPLGATSLLPGGAARAGPRR